MPILRKNDDQVIMLHTCFWCCFVVASSSRDLRAGVGKYSRKDVSKYHAVFTYCRNLQQYNFYSCSFFESLIRQKNKIRRDV